jgi:Fe-S oxidoreductase
VPWLVNAVTRSRLTRRAFARAAGIAADRMIPPLARTPFSRAHRRRRERAAATPSRGRARVVLWPDTFNEYLSPSVAHAGVRVLEAAGFEVDLPARPVCCGLTWHTTGQLETARWVLRRTLGVAGLEGSDPIVVLEPSCATMLREDLPELLPDDRRALSVASRVRTLAEVLDEAGFVPPAAEGPSSVPALSQPHCHQQAVLGLAADRRVLARSGIEVGTELVGCCGLAGNFGAERGHEAISRAVAELALIPGLRAAPDAPVLADGFSCRTQIEALSGRRARHLAEVLAERL